MHHRVRLRLLGPLGTPMTSGTLFGQLCWALREASGEAALVSFLARLPEAPVALSDVFPEGLLPRPILAPTVEREPPSKEQADKAKKLKKKAFVTRDHWLKARGRLSAATLAPGLAAWSEDRHRLAHNTIDRLRGGTLEQGGLFFMDEDWSFHTHPLRDLYVQGELPAPGLAALLEAIGRDGYGRDASTGRGRFEIVGIEPGPELAAHEGDRLVSLSRGCWDARMAAPRFKLWAHFGRLGAEAPGRPWKRPVVLLRPGATWARAEGTFGRWLTGVHQDRPEVGLNAFHLAIPFTEVPA